MPSDASASPRLQLALRFALRFVRGAAEVRASGEENDGVHVRELSLAIDGVRFPIDMSQGAHGFRRHRTSLRQLKLTLRTPALRRAVRQIEWAKWGLGDLALADEGDGYVLMGVVLASARNAATPFSLRLCVCASEADATAVQLVACDIRLYGAAGLSMAGLSTLVHDALAERLGAGVRRLDPWRSDVRLARLFAHVALPQFGWRATKPHAVQLGRLVKEGDALHVEFAAAASDVAAGDTVALPPSARIQQSALRQAPGLAAAWSCGDAEGVTKAVLSALAVCTEPRAQALLATWLVSEAGADAEGIAYQSLRDVRPDGDVAALWPPDVSAAESLAQALSSMALMAIDGTSARPPSACSPRESAARALLALNGATEESLLAQTPYDERALLLWGAAALLAEDAPHAALMAIAEARERGLHVGGLYALSFAIAEAQGERQAAERAARHQLSTCQTPAARAAVHVRRAELALRLGDEGPLAEECLADAIACDPGHWPAHGLAAVVVARMGTPASHAQAEPMIARLEQEAARESRAHRQAQALWYAARIAAALDASRTRARALLSRALTHFADHVPSLSLAAQLAQADGEGQVECRLLERLVAAAARLPRGSGDVLSASERLDAHLRLVEAAVRARGASPAAKKGSVTPIHHDESSADAEAAHHLSCALKLAPTRDDLRARLVSLLDTLGQHEQLAELWLRAASAAQAQGNFPKARSLKLEAAARLAGPARRPAEAASILLGLLAHAPADADALLLLLPLWSGAESASLAIDALGRAAEAQPDAIARARFLTLRAERIVGTEAPVTDKLVAVARVLQLVPQHLGMAQLQVELHEGHALVGDGEPAGDEALAGALEQLADALPAAAWRGRARIRAARAMGRAKRPEAARALLLAGLAEAPAEVDGWLLGLSLLEAERASAEGLDEHLESALRACHAAPDVHRLWAQRAARARQERHRDVARASLEQAIATGGATEAICEELLALLAEDDDTQAQAEWLLRFANDGWPLPVAQSYLRAATLLSQSDPQAAKGALCSAIQSGGEALWQAASLLLRLAEQHGWPEEVALGLEGMLRAVDEGLVAHADVPQLEHRLMWAHERRGAPSEAESICAAILQHEPNDPDCHVLLAQRLLARHGWDEALDHFAAALLGPERSRLDEATRARALEAALPLAASLRPSLLASFAERGVLGSEDQKAAEALMHEGAPLAFADVLRARGEAGLERTFLRHALERADSREARQPLRLRLAILSHQSADEAREAETWLRQSLLENPRDAASRHALVPLLEVLGNDRELAELHFALSQLVSHPDEALGHVVRSARYFLSRPDGRQMAADILVSFSRRNDVPAIFPPLWQSMRQLGFVQELARLLEQSLEASPVPDDGRLAELLEVLADDLSERDLAVRWCQRFEAYAPDNDTPWALHVEIVQGSDKPPSRERVLAAADVQRAWAEARSGEPRARIFESLAKALQAAGEHDRGQQALEQALQTPDADPHAAAARLQMAIEQRLCTGDFARAVPLLERALQAAHSSAEAEQSRRVLAQVTDEALGDPAGALEVALAMASPRAIDAERALDWACRSGRPQALLPSRALVAQLDADGRNRWIAALLGAKAWDALSEAFACLASAASARAKVLADAADETDETDDEAHFAAIMRARPRPMHDASDAALCAIVLRALGDDAPAGCEPEWLDALARLVPRERDEVDEPLRAAWDQLAEPAALQRLIQATDLRSARAARAAFVVARSAGLEPLAHEAARRLLAEADGEEAADVLVTVIEADIAEGELGRAKERLGVLSRRGDPRSQRLLECVLRAEGRWQEVLAMGRARAQATSGEHAPAAWLAYARDLLTCERGPEAQEALLRIEPSARHSDWAQLAFAVAQQTNDAIGEAEAAALGARCAADEATCATWLRREAHVRWWRLDDQTTARALLAQAQQRYPKTVAALLNDAAHDDRTRAREALQEALSVVALGDAAPLWIRLSSVRTDPDEAAHDLHQAQAALAECERTNTLILDEAEALIAAALRWQQPSVAAASHALVARAWAEQGKHAAAAGRWLEAARLAPAHEGVGSLALAAHALARANDVVSLLPLLEQLVGLNAPPDDIWPLVWAHGPARARAAFRLASNKQLEAHVQPSERAQAWLLAAEHALDEANDVPAADIRRWLVCANEAMRENEGEEVHANTAASWPRRAFHASERVAEAQHDVRALIALWRAAPRVLGLPADVQQARVRRAAYLAGGMDSTDRTSALWRQLLQMVPDDDEAQRQVWLSRVKHCETRAMSDACSLSDVVYALIDEMEQTLAALPLGARRAERTLLAAEIWQRVRPMPAIDVLLLGRAWQAAQGESAEPDRIEADVWPFVREVGEALSAALEREGRAHDALAVSGRLALAAPHEERLPWLKRAGERALQCGEWQQAFQFLWPVADHDPSSSAWQACLQICEQHEQVAEGCALWVAKAARAQAGEAAQALWHAAQWARKKPHGDAESLRLLEASYRLEPSGVVLASLLGAYADQHEPSAHRAGALLFDASRLVGIAEDNGAALAIRLAEQLLAHEPIPADAGRHLLEALAQHFSSLPQTLPVRLALARAVGSPAQRVHAQLALADHGGAPGEASPHALYAEAAQGGAACGETQLARRAALLCLADPHAPPSWGLCAFALREGIADAAHRVAYDEALSRALEGHLSDWQRFAATPTASERGFAHGWPAGWVDEQIAIWTLLCERADKRGDGAACAGALEPLCGWLTAAGDLTRWREATVRLARVLADEGAMADAIEVLAQVATRAEVPSGARVRAHVQLAQWSEQTGDTRRAGGHIEAAQSLCAQAPEARPAVALALVAAGRTAEARAFAPGAEDALLPDASAEAQLAALLCALPESMAWAHAERAPSADARALAHALCEREHTPPVASWVLAWAAEADSDVEAAQAAYRTASSQLLEDGPQLPYDVFIWLSWAHLQEVQGQPLLALDTLERGLSVHEQPSEQTQLLQVACDLAERGHLWERAADSARRLAEQADSLLARGRATCREAQIAYAHLGDWQRAATALWEVSEPLASATTDEERECAADVWHALWEVLDAASTYLPADGPWRARRLLAAEHVFARGRADALLGERGLRVAEALHEQAPHHALTLFGRIDAQAGVPSHLRGLWQQVAWRAEAWPQFIALAEHDEAESQAGLGETDQGARLRRHVALAEAHARAASDLEAARPYLMRAIERQRQADAQYASQNVDSLRRLADLSAGLPDLRDDAMAVYDQVLRAVPTDTEALRMAARVAGQQGDTERAYGLYACLLWLLPADAEAGRFVVACRARGTADEGHEPRASGRGRPLVKKVQEALDEVTEQGLLPEDARPARAYDVAQLLRADIEVVLGEMVSAPFGEPRAHALARVPEAMQLFRFAASPAYFAVKDRLSSGLGDAWAAPRTARAAAGD